MIVFTPNTVIRSTEVNSNFDDLDTRLTSAELVTDVLNGVYTTFTPTITNVTGSKYGSYLKYGKNCKLNIRWVCSTTVAGSITVTLPFQAASGNINWSGGAYALDTGITHNIGVVMISPGATTCLIYDDTSTGSVWNNVLPFTWNNGDSGSFSVEYETV